MSGLGLGLAIGSVALGSSAGASSVASSGQDLVRSSNFSKPKNKDYVSFNVPFDTAVQKKKTEYRPILEVPLDYDIYLDSSSLHWYLVVHCQMGDFPYISFEITTDKTLTLIPTMRIIWKDNTEDHHNACGYLKIGTAVEPLGSVFTAIAGGGGVRDIMLAFAGINMTKKGTIKTTMRKLSELAEKIRQEMGIYKLISNNCQHFCNNFLLALGLPTTTTTTTNLGLSHNTSVDNVDNIFEVVEDLKV